MATSQPSRASRRTAKPAAAKARVNVRESQLKPLGRNGFNYREQHGVIVLCDGEKHQARVYETLRRRGHRCRVVSV